MKLSGGMGLWPVGFGKVGIRIATFLILIFAAHASLALAQTGRIHLFWEPSEDVDLQHYNVYRSLSADGEFDQINSVPITEIDYIDSGLDNGLTYHYRITAVDLAGNESEYSNLASATTYEDELEPANLAPVAEAGDDLRVGAGATVALDGSASFDPDGEIIAYFWIQLEGPEVRLADETSSKTTFVAPRLTEDTTLAFELVVWDEHFASGMDQVNIRIDNALPVADAGADQTIRPGDVATLDGRDSYSTHGQITAWLWLQVEGPEVAIADSTAPQTTFRALNLAEPVVYTFELHVWDDIGGSSMSRVSYHTTNRVPEVDLGPDLRVFAGDLVVLDGTNASDPDGTIVAVMWLQTQGPPVTLSDKMDSTVTFIAPAVNTETTLGFELVVWDNHYAPASDEILVHVSPRPNLPPAANAGPAQTVAGGQTVTLDGSASADPDGQIVSWLWLQTQGPLVDLSSDSDPIVTFTAPILDYQRDLEFWLVVWDDDFTSNVATVTVTVGATANTAPVAMAGADLWARPNDWVGLDGLASYDADGDPLTYQWRQVAGTWVDLQNANTATPRFRAPNALFIDFLEFELTVSDGRDSHSDTMNVTVQRGRPRETGAE